MGTPPMTQWPIVLVSHVYVLTCLCIDTCCLYEQYLDLVKLCLFVFSVEDSRSVAVFGLLTCILFAVTGESCVYMQCGVCFCVCVYSGKTGQLINVCVTLPVTPNVVETLRSTAS